MKYIAKMMLALLASVTLVIPAYAWDFSASGSVEAKWEQSTTKASSSAVFMYCFKRTTLDVLESMVGHRLKNL